MALGVAGLATCSGPFCIWTYQYLADNVDELFSGFLGFLRVFPWGWLVQFCEDTFNVNKETEVHSPFPAFNMLMTYFSSFIFAAFLYREARRLKLTTNLGLSILGGQIVCFCAFIPGIFLVKRAMMLAEDGTSKDKDKHPLDLGKGGYVICLCSLLNAVAGVVLWVTGAAGGNEVVYGVFFFVVGLGLPTYFGVRACMDDPTPEIFPPSLFKKWLVFCAAVSGMAYVALAIGAVVTGESPSQAVSAWATRVFAGDLVILRLAHVYVLASDDKFGLAALEFLLGPFGLIMWLWGRASEEEASEDGRTELVES